MDKQHDSDANSNDKKQPAQPADAGNAGVQTPDTPAEKAPDADNDERFDFGGLPARNLKKNLGCGS